MNITYLIGNGFDLNLGLHTKYSDFIEWLNNEESSDKASIQELQKSIDEYCKGKKDDTINWSDTEVAFGLFTYLFKGRSNGDEEIDECHTYLCEKLSEYLQAEEKRVPIANILKDRNILDNIGKGLCNYTVGLTPVDARNIERHVAATGGGFSIRVIDFNYTNILDQLLPEVHKQGFSGSRVFQNSRLNNSITPPIHVHGNLTHGLIFGVDNEGQLCTDVFTDNEPERKRALIKQYSNEDMGEAIDERVINIINESHLIYVYGMSIGPTDKRWWSKILQRLSMDINCVLIIHNLSVPEIGLKPQPYRKFCRINRDKFLENGLDLSDDQIESIKQRIYFTNANAFSVLDNIVNTIPK